MFKIRSLALCGAVLVSAACAMVGNRPSLAAENQGPE